MKLILVGFPKAHDPCFSADIIIYFKDSATNRSATYFAKVMSEHPNPRIELQEPRNP